jgi:hypothetical protein
MAGSRIVCGEQAPPGVTNGLLAVSMLILRVLRVRQSSNIRAVSSNYNVIIPLTFLRGGRAFRHLAMELQVVGQLPVEAAAVQQVSYTAHKVVHMLLVAQRAHRIHAQRAAGRPQRGPHSGNGEHSDSARISHRIQIADAVKLPPHQPR